ncbi:MAG: beta-galactosidase, partial [Odoribacteraceae bacterium]|nr:beta-galactosidase [Odoribacteraceae bacterium]
MKRVIGIACLLALLAGMREMTAQETLRVMLSGSGLGDEVEWDFFCTAGARSGNWEKIVVPAQWELQGFGEYTYGRWYKEKGGRPSTEEGIYRRSFHAPAAWKGQRVHIVFEGVMTDAAVSINDRPAGETHRGGFYRFAYEISDKLHYDGENTIEVKVSKHSANPSVNAAERRADWWLFGGIYRPVYLEILPPASIDHVAVDARHDGSVAIRTTLRGAQTGQRLRATIRPLVGQGTFDTAGMQLAHGDVRRTVLSHAWKGVRPWNPEDPNLYVLTLSLEDERGKLLHVREERIGFRTVEFRRADGIYVNDVKIQMKGINRHSFWPDGGRCTNCAISVQDAFLIKEMNINAVRSHYPPDTHFLDACDSLGLFVIDELAGWQNAYDARVGARLQQEMVDRDVNHPSVILWSNGNEGGWNVALDAGFAEHDPQRRHVIHPWADFDGIDTHHYPAYLTGVVRLANGYDVFMPTEFMHGCYDQGHGAGLEDFWDRYKVHPLFAGAFMWDFSDNAVKRTDRGDTLDSAGELAADGILGPYREKEGSYYTVREVWAPVQFAPLYITPSFRGDFYITNEYLYTNLSRCSARYKLFRVDSPWRGGEQREVHAGEITLPSLDPGERGKLHLSLPEDFFEADVLEITAYDPYGREICTWSWPVAYAGEYATTHLPPPRGEAPASYREEGDRVLLLARGMEITFDKGTGMMARVVRDGQSLSFGNGPVPVGMNAVFKSYRMRIEGGDALFTARYAGAIDSIQWRLTPAGLLKMSAVMLDRASGGEGFDAALTEENIYNFGFSFDFPEERVTGMTWFGRGPYRVWKNRIKGTRHGRWTKGYNNTMTGASFENLVYPEFKGYHANLYWATLETREGDFTVMSESDGLFLRVFTPAEPAASRDRALPPFPPGDISFLYDIPGMRDFKPLSQHGPSAQPGSIRVKKGDEGIVMTLWFDFTAGMADESPAPRWPDARVEARPWTRWWW